MKNEARSKSVYVASDKLNHSVSLGLIQVHCATILDQDSINQILNLVSGIIAWKASKDDCTDTDDESYAIKFLRVQSICEFAVPNKQ